MTNNELGRLEVALTDDPSATCQGELGCECPAHSVLLLFPGTPFVKRFAFCREHAALLAATASHPK